MAAKGKVTFSRREGHGAILYLAARLVDDGMFPFEPSDQLEGRIKGDSLVIEKVGERRAQTRKIVPKGREKA